MRRTTGQTSNYVTTYAPIQSTGPASSGIRPGASTATKSHASTYRTGDTLVADTVDNEKEKEAGGGRDRTESAWKGKPNGTAYDRREELTEEDEDMWARLAM